MRPSSCCFVIAMPLRVWSLESPYSHSERHLRYAKRFNKSLSKRQRRLRRKYIPRPSLHLPNVSLSWRQMYKARQDQALITMPGFDFATLDWLSDKFAVLFDTHTPWNQTTGDIGRSLGNEYVLAACTS